MKLAPSAAAIIAPILDAIVLTNAADTDGSDVPSAIACGPCRALFEALRLVLDAYGLNGEEIAERMCDIGEYDVAGIEFILAEAEKELEKSVADEKENARFYARHKHPLYTPASKKGLADAKAKLAAFRAAVALISNGVRKAPVRNKL